MLTCFRGVAGRWRVKLRLETYSCFVQETLGSILYSPVAAMPRSRNAFEVGVRLLKARAPKAIKLPWFSIIFFTPCVQILILLVLLILWNDRLPLTQVGQGTLMKYIITITSCRQDFKFIEHYAGVGQMTNTMREEHGAAARLDLNYHRGHDILTPSGMA